MTNTLFNTFGAGLGDRVAIYVPSTVDAIRDGAALGDSLTAWAAGQFSGFFGGSTISVAAGAWMSADHGLIREQMQIVYSYCTREQLEQHAQDVRRIAEHIRDAMAQEAVSVEINGVLYFV